MNTKHHLNHLKLALIVVIVGALALPSMAQAGQHPRYKLVDLGTLGGPSSGVTGAGDKSVNNNATVVGAADTANPDPFDPNCFTASCFVQHAFKWQNGVLTDLGALPGGASSVAIYINERGEIAGLSQNGLVDPLTGLPESIAVLWKDGQIFNLGTLGGNESIATALNNRGQVVGGAANTIPDPFSLSAVIGNPVFATQTRAFLWDNGVMVDLGTLGGPDSSSGLVNEHGQVAGVSYIDSTPNGITRIPTVRPFLWEKGHMFDLGSLGGAFATVSGLNERGDVVGEMSLPGEESQHPYFWARGRLTDLGTLGGSSGEVADVNDAGEVVGDADLPNGLHDAFLWKNGVMTDLGNLGITSAAHDLNSRGQVVGGSRVSFQGTQLNAFLWENGGPMLDLNTLIPADSTLHLVYANRISDSGVIDGVGLPPGVAFEDINTRGHAFLLIPVGQE